MNNDTSAQKTKFILIYSFLMLASFACAIYGYFGYFPEKNYNEQLLSSGNQFQATVLDKSLEENPLYSVMDATKRNFLSIDEYFITFQTSAFQPGQLDSDIDGAFSGFDAALADLNGEDSPEKDTESNPEIPSAAYIKSQSTVSGALYETLDIGSKINVVAYPDDPASARIIEPNGSIFILRPLAMFFWFFAVASILTPILLLLYIKKGKHI